MPTPTYDLIQEQVLGSTASVITFSSVPGTYKDLVLEIVGGQSIDSQNYFQFNSDTGTNYSWTRILGDGSTASSSRGTNQDGIATGGFGTAGLGTLIYSIMSYANTSVNKTVLGRQSGATNAVQSYVGLWRNTAAITTIVFRTPSGTFNVGTTLRLWGVSG